MAGKRESVDVLYHFTCKHSKSDIGTSNCLLVPQGRHPGLGCKVIWLTTESEPDPEQTGLTHNLAKCDRMEYRYVVSDLMRCRPWIGSPERAAAPKWVVRDLEDGGDPEHWWITDQAVRARFDRTWRQGVPSNKIAALAGTKPERAEGV